jgi:hypothetical protein
MDRLASRSPASAPALSPLSEQSRWEDLLPPVAGAPAGSPSLRSTPTPTPEADPGALQGVRSRSEHARQLENLVDDAVELEQDAQRLARNVFGAAPRPMPVNASLSREAQRELHQATMGAIPKNPVGDKRLAHYGHRGQPPVSGRKRVLLGDAPRQTVVARPSGLGRPGSVTVG